MNPRAWCPADSGPCRNGCHGTCMQFRDTEPVIPNARNKGGEVMGPPAEYDGDRMVPAGFPVGVLIVLCTVLMAFVLGYIVGHTLQCMP